jgi:aminoglycoside phosphotransferase (APT) family kinase protein
MINCSGVTCRESVSTASASSSPWGANTARYLDRAGLSTRDWPFYKVFGLFRLAGIAQQIYYRYHHGHATNPEFRDLWVFVNYLDWRCRSIITQIP